MHLLIDLITRLVGVAVLCLAVAIGWVMVDAHRSIEAETAASAERIGRHLEGLYWQEQLWRGGTRKNTLLPLPEWQTFATLNLISPGVCVTFALQGTSPNACVARPTPWESPRRTGSRTPTTRYSVPTCR